MADGCLPFGPCGGKGALKMFSRIETSGMPPAAGMGCCGGRPLSDGRLQVSRQHYDQVEFSTRLSGLEKRVQDLTARLSQEVRARPTSGELRALQAQVASGTYQPDARETAARMLLLCAEEL